MKLTLYRDIYDWYSLEEEGKSFILYKFCSEKFHKITGIKLKKGECRKVKSIKITLGKVLK